MLGLIRLLAAFVANRFKSPRRLEIENLYLWHQLNIALRRTPQRVLLRGADRALLVWMTWLWPNLFNLSRVVKPDTILRWHRAGFRAYWRWKSRAPPGRPKIDRELRDLIRQMSRENRLWGAPRIHGELLKLGFEVAESTVSRYMVRHRGPPSQTWRTFLRNHADAIAAIDLCVVQTATFERLFVFIVVGHGRRQLLWFAVTRHPTAEWLSQQIVEAFPWGTTPGYLIRDNDGAYGQTFRYRRRAMGHSRSSHITEITLAESLCRAADRNAPPGVSGSCIDLWRAAFAATAEFVLLLLQRHAHASVIEQRRPPAPPCAAIWSYRRCSNPVRPTSPLPADMIFGRDRWSVTVSPVVPLSLPKIISGHNDGVARTRLAWLR